MPARFQSQLKELGDLKAMMRFEALEHFSIQGSSAHYCQPQKTVLANEYTHMEVKPLTLKARAVADHLFGEYQEGCVFANVPVALVQEALDVLEGNNG